MSKTLSTTDPRLQAGVQQMRRTLRVWGILLALYGGLTFFLNFGPHPVAGWPFILIGLLCLVSGDPLLLGSIAVLMSFALVPTLALNLPLFGPDLLRQIIPLNSIEFLAVIVGKILIIITALNQFMFYRFYYGTARAAMDDPQLPAIPEMVPNRTNRYARWTTWLAGLGLVTALLALGVSQVDRTAFLPQVLAELGGTCGGLALAVAFGVAFSPTDERPRALQSTVLGALAYAIASGVLWYVG